MVILKLHYLKYSFSPLLTAITFETAPNWHGFLTVKLAALAADGRAEQRTTEPQNIE
jgi:hypothetical protein